MTPLFPPFQDCKLSLFDSGAPLTSVSGLSGKTLSAALPGASARASVPAIKGSCCRFVNVKSGKTAGALLLENPVDSCLGPVAGEAARVVFGAAKLFSDEAKKSPAGKLMAAHNGKTLYA